MRLDVFLTEKELAVSRAKAQEMIKNGAVTVNGKPLFKPAFDVSDSDAVCIAENPLQRYVGRGGLKLEAALSHFDISVQGLVAVDVGASSGGFTDCLLQHGAAYVYAIDAGEGQLHPSLLADARVCNREKCNARYIGAKDFSPLPQIAVMDVSFISQTLILPAIADVLQQGGYLLTLIKPQFEVGKGALGKNGLVKKAADRERAIENVKRAALALGFRFEGYMESVIRGGDGNTEYMACFSMNINR